MSFLVPTSMPDDWTKARFGSLTAERNERVSDVDFPPLSVTMDGIVPQLEHVAQTQHNDNRKLVRAGDLVINSRSDRKGAAGLAPQDGSVSLISIVMRLRGAADGRFFHHLLRSRPFAEEFYRLGTGIHSDLWSTRYDALKRMEFGLPPIRTQHAIADFLDRETEKIDTLIEKKERLLELLDEKRTALITQAVTKGLDPDVPMKDSGVEWLGEIPEHWEVGRLNHVIGRMTNGYVGPTREIMKESGVPYIQGMHLESGEIQFTPNGPYYVSREWSEAHAKSILHLHDVLLVQSGQIGNVGIVREGFVGANCHALIITRTKSDILKGEYLAYLFRSEVFRALFQAIRTGDMLPHLNVTRVKYLPAVLPPLSEQSRIVRYLDHATRQLDRQVVLGQQSIGLLKELRTALISAAVTGQIDVTTQASA